MGATTQNETLHCLALGLGLLDLAEETAPPVEGEGEEAPEADLSGTESVEADLIEIGEGETEIAKDADQIENLEADSDTLEEVAVAMEAALKDGGMSRGEVKFARMAVDRINRRWKIKKQPIASMEAFGETDSKLNATRTSLEGIGESLKQFWTALMAKISALWGKLKAWVVKVTDAAPGLKKRAEAIAKKAGEVKGAPTAGKIPASTFKKLEGLHLGGKAPAAAAFKGAFGELVSNVEMVLSSKHGEHVSKSVDHVINILNEEIAKGKAGRSISMIQQLTTFMGESAAAIGATTKADGRGEGETHITKEMPGGMCFAVTVGKAEGDSVNALAKTFKIAVAPFSAKKVTVEANGNFDTLSGDDVKGLCGEVGKLADALSAFRNGFQSREAAQKKMDEAIKKATSAVDRKGEGASEEIRSVKDCGMAVTSLWRAFALFDTSVVGYAFRTARDTLAYCDKSLAQYGAKAEGAKAEGEGKKEGEGAAA